MKFMSSIIIIFFTFLMSCSTDDSATINPDAENPNPTTSSQYKYLALGDSYTIGQSVCETCRFPEQLKDSILNKIDDSSIDLDIIAVTGWTTTNLKTAINAQNPSDDYDLVTLLIGVNNQYQGKPFSLYENEFPELLNTAIEKAKGNKERVVVVSIPDYAYTPFGRTTSNPERISQELDRYNAFAKEIAEQEGVTFVNITDITREGNSDPSLVASDGLHPSEKAYSRFVETLLPLAIEKIKIEN
ncbi:Lysophospholipase L1 [Flavobacteriaceae bacterium MAR_2010_188]|nr:Lysophospholipase L1 [Flavobacteriaceae bacterium MAR_2010_188]